MIDLRDTDEKWYFAITEVNNYFIIRTLNLHVFLFKSFSDSSEKQSGIIHQWSRIELRMRSTLFAAKHI